MLWLLDQYLVGIRITEYGGLTKRAQLDDMSVLSPSLNLLYVLGGMKMFSDHELLQDLQDHIENPDYFDPVTDSYDIARTIRCIKAQPLQTYLHHVAVVSRMRTRYSKAFNELVDCRWQDTHLLDFKQSYELFGKWDVEYGFDKRPKSDVVMRALARECKWRIPKCRWLGWDMKPLETWEYSPPTLLELAMKIKRDMDSYERGLWHIKRS